MTELSHEEVNRYARHIILPEVGPSGQKKLKESSVLLVGAGGLGSPLALYLTAAGVGRIGIIDFDVVDASNLQRQILHGTSTIGMSKLESAKQRLTDLNPHIQLELISDRLHSGNALELFKQYDVIADGTDNFPTRYLVNDACVLANKPNVYGSIFRFEGQVTVFNNKGGPCYRCLYPDQPPPGLVPSCAEGGVLGILPGVVGSLQATEVIKVLLDIGTTLSERLLAYDALKMAFRELKLRRDPDCKLCSDHPEVTTLIDYEQFCGIGAAKTVEENVKINELSVQELKEWSDNNQAFKLIDVREPHEYDICNIKGSSLIPLNTIQASLQNLDKKERYVVHCKMGGRSEKAVRMMKKEGFSHVWNLRGGINQWSEEIDPSLPTY